jgi:predicted nucleotidyltransferase
MREKPKLFISGISQAVLSLGDKLLEAEAIGIFGSLARGDFHDRSDIDIFVVVQEKKPGVDVDKLWWDRINEALKDYQRDVTVLVYSIEGLKRIITWYVLRLASEGIFIYDKGGVKELFVRIIKTAKEAGLVERKIGTHKVWTAPKLKLGERLVLEVKE